MKNNKLKLWLASAAAFLSLVSLVVSVSYVRAGSTFSWPRVEDKTADRLAAKVETPEIDQDISLGAVTGPDLPTPYVTNNLIIHTVNGSFIDASTTIVSIPNPFLKATTTANDVVISTDGSGKKYTGATTTVDLANLTITTAATTSFNVACGGSSTAVPTLPLSIDLVTTTLANRVATSSIGTLENNISAAQGALVNGGSTSKIVIDQADPYFVCLATPSVAAGLTNALNTFDGKFTVRFYRQRL